MPGLRTQSTPTVIHPNAEKVAVGLEKIAWLMDRAIPIPGTNLRVGIDAILGLVPGWGDSITGVIQTIVVLTTLAHYRVPKAVAARMAANVVLDNVVGFIPFVGDVFDMGFKANTRNMALLREVRERQNQGEAMPSAPSIRYLVTVGVVLVGVLSLLFVAVAAVTLYIAKLIFSH